MQIPSLQVRAIIHFINTKAKSGSDAILRKHGHYALIDMGEDYDFPMRVTRYPSRWGISMKLSSIGGSD